jgi:adenosylmethionine-8-amino-7-oxononanoate aminotransferase
MRTASVSLAQVRPFHRAPGRDYPVIVRGEGVWLWDDQGRRYLDAASGALVSNIGHGRHDVIEAAARQARALDFVHGSQFSSRALHELAEQLAAFAPPGAWRFFATSGGSEANESAIKLVRQLQVERGRAQRHVIVTRSRSYHGASLGGLAASGMGARKALYTPLLREEAFAKVPPPDPSGDVERDAREVEALLDRIGADRVAAVVLEPVIGAAAPGLAPPSGSYAAIRAVCERHDVLLVFDEVMSGLGRTGRGFALEHWGTIPDVIVVGKGLGAGYAPLAGILVREDHVQTIANGSGSFVHGFTYAGHPVSAAVGTKVLQVIAEEGLVDRAHHAGARLLAELRALAASHPEVHEVRGYGLLIGVVLGAPGEPRSLRRPGYAYAVNQAALAAGLNVYPGGGAEPDGSGDHLLIGPPLTIDDGELSELVARLDTALTVSRPELAAFDAG